MAGEGEVKIEFVATSRVPNAVTLAYTQHVQCISWVGARL